MVSHKQIDAGQQNYRKIKQQVFYGDVLFAFRQRLFLAAQRSRSVIAWGGGKERFLLGIDLILVHNIQPFLRKYSCDIYHNTIKSLPHKRWMLQEEGEYFGKKILKNRKKRQISDKR